MDTQIHIVYADVDWMHMLGYFLRNELIIRYFDQIFFTDRPLA